MLFGLKRKEILGIDWSERSLKIVSLGGNEINPILFGLTKEELPQGVVLRGKIIKKEEFKKVLKKAIEKPQFGEFKTKEGVLSLPEIATFSHIFSIPSNLSLEERKKEIVDEMVEVFPFLPEELYFGFESRGVLGGNEEIFLSAFPKESLKNIIQVFKEVGIEILVSESEAQSLFRVFGNQGNILVVDIGFERTNLIIFDQKGIILSFVFETGTLNFIKGLQEKFNLSFEESERLIFEFGLDFNFQGGRLFLILQKPAQEIIWEIRKIEDYFQRKRGKKIEKILLSGGGGMIPLLKDYFEENLKEKVEIGDPWGKINIEILKKKEYYERALQINPSAYSVAIGASLRGLKKNIKEGIGFFGS